MNKHVIKGIIFVSVVLIGVFLYLKPFTQSQIYNTVDLYFNNLQELKQDSLTLMTTSTQAQKDKESMTYIKTQYGGNYEFTNRTIKIVKNSFTDATVEFSTVVKKTKNGTISAVPTRYNLILTKALNVKGDKVWIVVERKQIEN